MKIVALIVFSIIFIVVLIFSLLNFHSVQINLFFISVQLPLVLVLTLQLIAGIIIGALATFIQIIKLKTQYANLNKKLRKTEKQDSTN